MAAPRPHRAAPDASALRFATAPPSGAGTLPMRRRIAVQRVVLIVSSTGGPRALARLLPGFPRSLGGGVVIVQHMPNGGYTGSLAAQLDEAGPMEVREANSGDVPMPRRALLAPGGHHLRFESDGRALLTDSEPIGGLRPRADLTISDAVAVWGERLVLVVLTGMGSDGLEGARAVRDAGGRVVVQSAASCTVYGMPRAVAAERLADVEVDLAGMAAAIVGEVRR